jgi:tRNA (adenine57-N1/adenine58-N1)-methyltransferase
MNFAKGTVYDRPRLMADGDLVIVYERHDALSHIYLSTNEIFNNKFGAFHHNDMIGKPFGSKVVSKCTDGWIHLLEPTPELWASALNVTFHLNYVYCL